MCNALCQCLFGVNRYFDLLRLFLTTQFKYFLLLVKLLKLATKKILNLLHVQPSEGEGAAECTLRKAHWSGDIAHRALHGKRHVYVP